MPSRIECREGHRADMLLREAAVRISQNQALGTCKDCGGEFHYVVRHVYANDDFPNPIEWRFEVVKAARLDSRLTERYDPFLLVLRDERGREEILPVFWAPGKNDRWLWGQFSPLLTLAEWNALFAKLHS